jgi:hypothetical protein
MVGLGEGRIEFGIGMVGLGGCIGFRTGMDGLGKGMVEFGTGIVGLRTG